MQAPYINKMRALFEEKQRYSQWWLWLITASGAGVVLGIFGTGIFQQLIQGEPWGDKPLSDDSLVIISLLAVTCVIGTLLLFFASVMETVVESDSVSYRFLPLIRHWRRIEKESILSYQKQSALRLTYGISKDLNGDRLINVKGRDCIMFILHDGKKLMLGTQNAQEFLNALDKMKSGRTD
jgi:hypothetical protein